MSGERRIESSSCAAVNPLSKIVFPLKKLVRYCPSPDIGLCVGGNSFFWERYTCVPKRRGGVICSTYGTVESSRDGCVIKWAEYATLNAIIAGGSSVLPNLQRSTVSIFSSKSGEGPTE